MNDMRLSNIKKSKLVYIFISHEHSFQTFKHYPIIKTTMYERYESENTYKWNEIPYTVYVVLQMIDSSTLMQFYYNSTLG